MEDARLTRLEMFQDERGKLVALHGGREVPFAIQRTYFIFDVGPGFRRGFHAHFQEQQFLVCLRGRCEVTLDDGCTRSGFSLFNPREGLFVEKRTWIEMTAFSDDCLLLVLSSTVFDPDDYIDDYARFQQVLADTTAKGSME